MRANCLGEEVRKVKSSKHSQIVSTNSVQYQNQEGMVSMKNRKGNKASVLKYIYSLASAEFSSFITNYRSLHTNSSGSVEKPKKKSQKISSQFSRSYQHMYLNMYLFSHSRERVESSPADALSHPRRHLRPYESSRRLSTKWNEIDMTKVGWETAHILSTIENRTESALRCKGVFGSRLNKSDKSKQ